MLTSGLIMLAQAPGKVASEGSGLLFPPRASTAAEHVDTSYLFILGVSTLVVLAVLLVFVLILTRQRKSKQAASSSTAGNPAYDLVWSVVPGILMLGMFWFGFKGYMDIRTPPSDSAKIEVTAMKYRWEFSYPNGNVTDELHLPHDAPATLIMTSKDVMHSLFVPAFRIKQAVLPERTTETWVQATKQGEYAAFCSEYCGAGHSEMVAKVVVHGPGGYQRWLDDFDPYKGMTPVEAGAKIYKTKGCIACHTLDGNKGVGPSWKGVFGTTEQTDKGPVAVDDAYIRESILEPNARIVEGYPPVMPPMPLTDEEFSFITEFIKSLKGE